MKTVDNKIKTCPHRREAEVLWVRNDGQSAPILFITGVKEPITLSLTNQTITVTCPQCFQSMVNLASNNPYIGLDT
jgi:hypothetical protein